MGWWDALKRTAASVTTPTAGRAALFIEITSGSVAQKDEAGVIGLLLPQHLRIPVVSGAVATGTNLARVRMPYKFRLTGVRAALKTAQATDGAGGILTVDVNEAGASLLSTKLTIDNTEKTSTTAAAAAVVSDSELADDAEITVDVDQIGDGTAEGLDVYLIGYPTT